MGLSVFALHDIQAKVARVNEVAVVRLVEVVKGRVVDELTNAAHRDSGHADIILAVVDEALLRVVTLFEHFGFQLLKELGAASQDVWLAAVALELTDFISESLGQGLVGRGGRNLVGTDKGSVSPELIARGGSVDATNNARGGVVSDEEGKSRDKLVVLGAVLPKHFVERTRPAFSHVSQLVFKQVGQNGDISFGVSADVGAVKRVNDRDAVKLEFGKGKRDTSMDFLPGEGHTLEVVRVIIRNGVVTHKPLDGGRVFGHDRYADETLAAWEGLLLSKHLGKQRSFLDGLGKRITLDVIIKSGVGYGCDFRSGERGYWVAVVGHGILYILGFT